MNENGEKASESGTATATLRVLSLFCNCGGLDLGFVKTNNFTIVRAIDPDQNAVESYKANIVEKLQQRHILLQTGQPNQFAYQINEADIVIGAPPCSETLNQSNICSLSRRNSPAVCDLVNTVSLSPLKRETGFEEEDEISATSASTGSARAAAIARSSSSVEDEEEDACKNKNNNKEDSDEEEEEDEEQKAPKRASLGKKKKLTVAAIKKKRKNAALLAEGSPSACSHATSLADDATDNSGSALDRLLRTANCIVNRWPVDPMPPSCGYRQWWCAAIYYRRPPPHRIVAAAATAFGENCYDADTENDATPEQDDEEEVEEEVTVGNALPRKRLRGGQERQEQQQEQQQPFFVLEPAAKKRRKQKKPTKKQQREAASRPLPRFAEPSVTADLLQHEASYDDDAIFDFLNIVGRVQPMLFVMVLPPKILENVDLEPMYDEIMRTASVYNYVLESVVLDASEFGVPQTRRRAFIIGRSRTLADVEFANVTIEEDRCFIGPKAPRVPLVSAGQVLRQMPPPGVDLNLGICRARVVPTRDTNSGLRGSAYAGQIFNGGGRPIDLKQPCNTFSRYIGGNFTSIVDQAHVENPDIEPWYETYYRALKENDEDAIAALLPVPPNVRRLTVTEAKVLTGFDIDFQLCGSHSAQFRQVGGACVPQVALCVAQYVAQLLCSAK